VSVNILKNINTPFYLRSFIVIKKLSSKLLANLQVFELNDFIDHCKIIYMLISRSVVSLLAKNYRSETICI
jgi:hypothetical protein